MAYGDVTTLGVSRNPRRRLLLAAPRALAAGDSLVVRYSIRATAEDAAAIESQLELPSTMAQFQAAASVALPTVAVASVATQRVADPECPAEPTVTGPNVAVSIALLLGFAVLPCCCGACAVMVCQRLCCKSKARNRAYMYSSQVGSASDVTANPHSHAMDGKPIGTLVTKTV